jgi:ubiquinone/menaquinone biosynthesis C-methylase UbiE
MGFTDIFANNLLVKWLRGDTGRYDLIVSMVGVKLGERLAQLGGGDGNLLAALGGKTGLTGQVVGVEEHEADAGRVQQTAEKAGVLADAATAPGWKTTFGNESFDLAILPQFDGVTTDLGARLAEAFRLLRMGGRCTVILRTGKAAAPVAGAGAGGGTGGAATGEALIQQFQQHGFRAARLLAERDGLAFYEALKK